MPVEQWPSTLPQRAVKSNYSESVRDGRQMPQPDVGPPMTRNRMASAARTISLSFIMTAAQTTYLDYFWKVTLRGGVKPFTIRDMRLDGLPLTDENGEILVDENGNILTHTAFWFVLFGEKPTYTPLGGSYWNVALTVVDLPTL